MKKQEHKANHWPLIEAFLAHDYYTERWAPRAGETQYEVLERIFVYGACFDFSAVLSHITDWPVHEIHWGADEDNVNNIHRVVLHPSGRFIDASGWTSLEEVLSRFEVTPDMYLWHGEVDPEGFLEPDANLLYPAVADLLRYKTGLLVAQV